MTGKCFSLGMILLIVILIWVLIPPIGAQGSSSLTRGQTFTVTIVGKPNIPYYVWLKGTFSLSGEPGEQPPVIASSQENIVQDPAGGPFVIGLYKYYGGGGRTILDDVAPSTPTVSNTSYYAQVTTDSNGYGIVAFRTSQATAAEAFSVVAQNPAAPGQDVTVALGVPTLIQTPLATLPVTSVLPTPLLETIMTTAQVPTVQATVMATPVPSNVSGPVNTPTQRTQLPALFDIMALGIVVLVLGTNRG